MLFHGDPGTITKDDVVLIIGNSGKTHEIVQILPVIKKSYKNYKIKTAISIIIVGVCIPRLEVYELIVFIIPIIFLFENLYNFKEDRNIYKIFLNFLFISLFLLNGDSGITYPFLIVFTFSTLFFFNKRNKLNV